MSFYNCCDPYNRCCCRNPYNDNICCRGGGFPNPRVIVGPQGPIGPQGPVGPQGPAALVNSILLGNQTAQTVAAAGNIGLGTLVNATSANMTYTAPNTITLQPGTYLVQSAMTTTSAGTTGEMGASIAVNGVEVPTASSYVTASATPTTIALQHNLTVLPGTTATVTLVNGSANSNVYDNLTTSIIKLI